MNWPDALLQCLTASFARRTVICLLGVFIVSSDARSQPTLPINSAQTVELGPSERQLFTFTLKKAQLIKIAVGTEDLNLHLRIATTDDQTLTEAAQRRYGPLSVSFIAPQTAEYSLIVSSLEHEGSRRTYQLAVEQIGSVSRRERNLALASLDFNRAEVLRFMSEGTDPSSVLQGYQQAALAWLKEGETALAARAWQQVGEVHFNRGNYQEALRAFDKALQIKKKDGDPFSAVDLLASSGYVQIYLGDLDKAEKIFAQCQQKLGNMVATYASSERKLLDAQLQNNYGEVEYGRGNLKGSLKLFARALELFRELHDRRSLALVHLNAGFTYLDSGTVNEASGEFELALKLCREAGDRHGEARTKTALGNLYNQLGDNFKALTAHREARDIFHHVGDEQGEAVTSNGLGQVLEDLNRKQEAIDEYSLALRLNHKLRNRDFEAVSAYYLGRVFRDLGDFTKSLEYYEKSLALSRHDGKSRMAALAMLDMAGIYVKQRRLTEADVIYQEVLAFYKGIADLRREALTHHGIGGLLRVLGQSDSAVREYQLGLALFERIKEPQGQADSHYWLAKLSLEQGKLVEALAESQKSIDLIEIQRARVMGQNWRSSYFASVRRHFELHVDILMQLDRQQPSGNFAARAIETSENARARSLLEQLAETQSEIRRGVDPALLAREEQLRQQLSAKGAYQVKILNSARNADEAAEVDLEIRKLNTEYDFTQAQIRSQSPGYSRIIQPLTVTVKEIQASLKEDPGSMLLEYMLGDDRSYVWLVTSTSILARELPGRQRLESLTHEVYKALTPHPLQPKEVLPQSDRQYQDAEASFCPNAVRLSETLFGPFLKLATGHRLLLVMDGSLQYVPFEALPMPGVDGSYSGCRLGVGADSYIPILTRFEVVNLPSFSSLLILRLLNTASPRPPHEVAVWADPVFESDDPRIPIEWARPVPRHENQSGMIGPLLKATDGNSVADPYAPPTRLLATEEEAQSIMRFAPAGLSVLLTGFAANRENAIKDDLYKYRILHFATHGVVNDRYPSLSGLLLSTFDDRGKTQNGLLQLHDIYGLHLNADLVVLSGCQTGLGKELSGEGLIGLTQSFLYAGSRSVVVTLWDVQDRPTATLMTDFYRAMLKEGMPPAAALRQAKLNMYREGLGPSYWAAFVIQGEFRPSVPIWHGLLRSNFIWVGIALLGIASWLTCSYMGRCRQKRLESRRPV